MSVIKIPANVEISINIKQPLSLEQRTAISQAILNSLAMLEEGKESVSSLPDSEMVALYLKEVGVISFDSQDKEFDIFHTEYSDNDTSSATKNLFDISTSLTIKGKEKERNIEPQDSHLTDLISFVVFTAE